MNPHSQAIVARAQVSIAQALHILEQLGEEPSVDDPGQSPESCLDAADNLWRQLVNGREAKPELWNGAEVDGLRGEQVLSRLNNTVYELFCAIVGHSWRIKILS